MIVDSSALWEVLKIYGVGGKLLDSTKSLYKSCKANVKVGGRLTLQIIFAQSLNTEVNYPALQECKPVISSTICR